MEPLKRFAGPSLRGERDDGAERLGLPPQNLRELAEPIPGMLLDDAQGIAVFIRQGNEKKDRMIPMGERAFAWVMRYVEETRPSLALTPDDGVVFLTNVGLEFEPNRLTRLVRDYVDAAEIGKTGSCQLFRRTCATLTLEGGGDIRFIQRFLGYEKLETTQIYAQVSIRMLKEVHQRTHRARLTAAADPAALIQENAELAAELAEEEAELAAEEALGSVKA